MDAFAASVAAAATLMALCSLDASDRAWLLYYDGDSVLPALVSSSFRNGEPQDWALSPVLFLLELGVFLALGSLGLSIKATFIAFALVSLASFYAALRFAASCVVGRAQRSRAVLGTLSAFGYVLLLVSFDRSADRNSLEVPSLITTATYYGSTTVAMVVGTALVSRICGHLRPRLGPIAWLGGVVAFSVLTNPIFLAWFVVPMCMTLLLAVIMRAVESRRALTPVISIALGACIGIALRSSLERVIVSDVSGYAAPSRALDSAAYYATLVVDRLSTVHGAASIVATGSAIIVCGLLWRNRFAARNPAGVIAASFGVLCPAIVCVGFIAMGTEATRYLAPLFFAPTVAITLLPGLFRRIRRPSTRSCIVVGAVTASAALSTSVLGGTHLKDRAARIDADIACVVDWVESTGQIVTGEFWTVRGPKAYLRHPNLLIQVNADRSPYQWLINRADYDARSSSHILTGQGDIGPHRESARGSSPAVVQCGVYVIHSAAETVDQENLP